MIRQLLTGSALMVGLAHACASHAQTNSALSEALFRDAKRLTAAGNYAEACPKLEESYRLDPGTGTLLNLGVCYEKTDMTAKAWATFNEAASSARREGRADRFKMATDHAKALEPILSRLVVAVAPSAEISGLEVRVDDTVLGKASWGFAMPYDPGPHQVTATAPGRKPFKAAVVLGNKADRKEITLGPLEVEPSPKETTAVAKAPPTVTSRPPSPTVPSDSSGSGRVPMYLVGGLGVVGLGVGTYFGLQAFSKRDASNQICPGTLCEDPGAVAKMEAANRDAWISNVGFGVGVVGVGVATYLFFAGRAPSETKSAVTVVPVVGLRGGGVSLSRAW